MWTVTGTGTQAGAGGTKRENGKNGGFSEETGTRNTGRKPGDNAPAPEGGGGRCRRAAGVGGVGRRKSPPSGAGLSLRTMDTLSVGESATVTGVTLPSDRLRLRLLDLGFVPGTRVRLIGHAPGGDPVTVALRGYELALCRRDAGRVTVTAAGAGQPGMAGDTEEAGAGAPPRPFPPAWGDFRPRFPALDPPSPTVPRNPPSRKRGLPPPPAGGNSSVLPQYTHHPTAPQIPAGAPRPLRILLAGNPNAGKSALFNRLTGGRAKVGNYPGVTVECKSGFLRESLGGGKYGRDSAGARAGNDSCKTCSGCCNDRGCRSHRGFRDRPAGIERGQTGDVLPGFSFPDSTPHDPAPPAEIVDLPGVYSLRPFSGEERVALTELQSGEADCVISVADATVPRRSLYLTMQLADRGVPVVFALNRIDALRRDGGDMDTARLSRLLGIPVVSVSAVTGEGVGELAATALRIARNAFGKEKPPVPSARNTESAGQVPSRRQSSAPTPYTRKTGTAKNSPCAASCSARETQPPPDSELALAAARYRTIDRLCHDCFTPAKEGRGRRITHRLDRLFVASPLAYPIFFLLLALVFAVTFPLAGRFLTGLLEDLLGRGAAALDAAFSAFRVSPAGTRAGSAVAVLYSFLSDGLLRGVGSVVGFLPVILILFFFLAILEDSGYLARAAYLFDRPLRRVGLTGRSAVPVLLGFGCTVPALLSARTLPTEDARRRTAFFLPFVSCSAKLPVYLTVAAAFFPPLPALCLLYGGGILAGVLSLAVFRRAGKRKPAGAGKIACKRTACGAAPGTAGAYIAGDHSGAAPGTSAENAQNISPETAEEPFLLELPDYRMPRPAGVLRLLYEKAAEFVGRAFSVILFLSAVIWFLSSFGFDGGLYLCDRAEQSLLAFLCRGMLPLLRPLGFSDWRIPAALVTGLFAKESVVSTLSSLGASPAAVFSPASAAAFLAFVLLYPPCAAAESCTGREIGRGRAVGEALFRLLLSYLVAAVVFRIAGLL